MKFLTYKWECSSLLQGLHHSHFWLWWYWTSNQALWPIRIIRYYEIGLLNSLSRMLWLTGIAYNLQSFSDRHFCLKCLVTPAEAKLAPSQRRSVALRSLDTMAEDLERFTKSGANLEQAKLFNNVIAPSFFDIPLEQVCIKGFLHFWSVWQFSFGYNSCTVLAF